MLELSIVIVVIALIIGGIIAGKDLIRSSQIRNTIGEVIKYNQAIQNFKDKYKALPGDFGRATSLWGTDPGGCPDVTTGLPSTTYSNSLKKETCNGNGDGIIQKVSDTQDWEPFRLWQHLSASGLVDGWSDTMFNGYYGVTGEVRAGLNLPSLSIPGSSIMVYKIYSPATTRYYAAINSHVMHLGIVNRGQYAYIDTIFTTPEAFEVDSKWDDGFPTTGDIFVQKRDKYCGSSTAGYMVEEINNETKPGLQCSMLFMVKW